jgi:hypothetical protein
MSEDEDFDKEALLQKQRSILLSVPSVSVVIYRYPNLMQAVEKADEINNNFDEEWNSLFFCATFSRKAIDGSYEVLVRVRPGNDRHSLAARYKIFASPSGRPLEAQVFITDMGGDPIAARSVNALARKGIKSLAALRNLYGELGEEEFTRQMQEMRSVGPASVELIVRKAKGE